MDKILKQALLYDFYGELLTEHQKSIYEDFVLNDYSLSEIGEDRNISRQGVYDIIKRCDKLLNGYEEKLHLIQKFLMAKEQVAEIHKLASEILKSEGSPEKATEYLRQIENISNGILEEM
jgi:predicted DNA-binding protein YlxM (UPF0122 family)